MQISIQKYLISFCVILLLGAFAVSMLAFARAASSVAAAPPSNGYGWAHGCPSNGVVGKTPPANVTVTEQQANTIITVHGGDLISFQFPFGSRWGGPTASQGNLALMGPAGYAVRTAQICVWNFMALGPGTTQLNFSRGPLCKPNQPCPFMSMLVPFTVKVK